MNSFVKSCVSEYITQEMPPWMQSEFYAGYMTNNLTKGYYKCAALDLPLVIPRITDEL